MNNNELKVRENIFQLTVEGGQLKVTVSFHNAVAVIALEGRLVLGAECEALRHAVCVVRERRQNRIIFDLAATAYIDSAGLGLLAVTTREAEDGGGSVCIANSAQRISDLLQITRIATMAPLHDDVDAAIRSITLDRRDDAA